ncbi:MAG: aspartate aminotransferase family protein [Bryobacteraceae bacterium]
MAATQTNLEYWQQYGNHVLMAMPYADEILVEGRGSTLRDANGRNLIDLASGMFCCVLGHNHPKFIERITQQTQSLLHTGTQFLSPPVLEAGFKLAQVAPGALKKCIFLSTGTEANEFAFRLAKTYTGRTGIVGFSRGYYGTSVATKSCSNLFAHHLKDSLPLVPDNRCLPIGARCLPCFTDASHPPCGPSCLDDMEDWIGDWDNVAAVIVEPVFSAGGMLFPPAGYIKRLRNIAHQHGALLIVDEAQTGFGRTGKWFAIEHHDVEPDILSLSKSIGNGFPVAAVVTTEEIADRVVSAGLWNLSSHQSDPVSAAAVCAVIDIVREEGLLDCARDNGTYFLEQLQALAARQPALSSVRGLGLMIGFDLAVENALEAAGIVNAFMYVCRRRGVHLTYGYGGTNVRIIPPLVITRSEIEFAVEVIEQSIAEVLANRSVGASLPLNPYTRRLVEKHPWGQLLRRWWHSSPQEWVQKGSGLIRKQLGVAD